MMEKENLTNPIDEDLERRNRNWAKIDKLKEDLEEEVEELRDDLAEHKLDYAEYLESELGEEHIIRSLPNGVKDEIDLGTGKLIKRVSDEFNTWELVWKGTVSSGSTTENYWSVTSISLSGLVDKTETVRWNLKNYNGIAHINFVGGYNSTDELSSIISPNNDMLYLKIPKVEMEIVSSSNIMAWLEQNQVTLTYQLAEPVEIPLPDPMTPNTREIVRLSEQVDKLTAAIIAMGGTIV